RSSKTAGRVSCFAWIEKLTEPADPAAAGPPRPRPPRRPPPPPPTLSAAFIVCEQSGQVRSRWDGDALGLAGGDEKADGPVVSLQVAESGGFDGLGSDALNPVAVEEIQA